MTEPLSRREFLERSSRLLAGAGAASLLVGSALGEEREVTLPVGCRDANLKETGQQDCWSAMRSIGAEVVEATITEDLSLPGLFHPGRKYSAATPTGIEQLAADASAANCRISALCTFNRFAERPDLEVQWCSKAARAAKALGIRVIRIDVVPQKLARAEFLPLAVKTLKRLIEATDDTGVAFAIENHGDTTNDPEFLKPLFDRVGSKRLGLTLDTGNFYWFGHPLSKVYELFQAFAPRVFHTHCKSIKFPQPEREKQRPMGWEYGKYNCPIYEGDIDFRRVLLPLIRAGYTGDLCVEDESLGRFPADERGNILAKEVRYLKDLRRFFEGLIR
jgi:sugar phosphate isomerase/epimerase